MPQKRPTKPPTTTRLCTGTKVKFTRDTRGHSFNPDVAIGQKFCQLSAEVLYSSSLETYSLTVAHNRLSVLALERAH
jgi:hypothetical protein